LVVFVAREDFRPRVSSFLSFDMQRPGRLLALREGPGYPAGVRGRRWIWALAGSVVAVLVIAALVLPGIARRKAVAAARARGIELTVGSARVGFFRATLSDVHATLEGVGDVNVHVATVNARWGLSGVGDIEAVGVTVDLNGTPDSIRSQIDDWKARHPSPNTGGAGSARTITLRESAVHWKLLGIELATAGAREASIGAQRVVVRGGELNARLGVADATIKGLNTEIVRADGKIGATSADAVTISVTPTAGLPVAALALKADSPTNAQGDAWSLLTRMREPLEKAVSRFESGVEIRIGEVTIATEKGSLGPWAARAVLGTDAIAFEIDPSEKAGRKPLVLRALIPRAKGKWTSELRMGPAMLGELGVAEGVLGLNDVAKTSIEARGSVEIDPDEKTFAADGSLTLKGASINDARIADGIVRGIDLTARGVLASKGDLQSWTLTGGAVELGKVRFEIEGGYETVELKDGKRGPRVYGSWTIPKVACGDALTSMPSGLLAKLDGMEMQGTFAASGRLTFDARLPDKTSVDLNLEQKCRVTKVPPALAVEKFKEPFELRVYDPKGNPRTARFGPGTPEWVSLEKISPKVVDALMVCEDGAFFVHNGFSAGSIRNALVANIKAGKFAVGASTITMQLAKNVFLDRRKQLSRKLQEAVLTAWLEQAMSKSELLELYLNVIEFGPNIYGIGPASWHWFGRPASDLDAAEAIFLISILPSPVKRHYMWDKGEIGDGYNGYLKSLLKEARSRGKIEEDEYQAAIGKPLTFHKPGMPTPPPHGIQPAKGPLDGKGGVDDAAFDPGGFSPPAD
jgi:hypothetical protein